MEYKIAVTTSAGDIVDLHFGQADNFSIYTIDSESGKYVFLEKRVINDSDTCGNQEGMHSVEVQEGGCCACNSGRAEYIANLLSDCIYLLTGKIGNQQHRNLLSYGISAMETPYPLEYAIKKINDYKKQQHKELL